MRVNQDRSQDQVLAKLLSFVGGGTGGGKQEEVGNTLPGHRDQPGKTSLCCQLETWPRFCSVLQSQPAVSQPATATVLQDALKLQQ